MWDWLVELFGGAASDGASLDWLLGASDAADTGLIDFAPQALDLSSWGGDASLLDGTLLDYADTGLIDFAPQALDFDNASEILGTVDNAFDWAPEAVDFGNTLDSGISAGNVPWLPSQDNVSLANHPASVMFGNEVTPSGIRGISYGAANLDPNTGLAPSWYDQAKAGLGEVGGAIRGVTAPVSELWDSISLNGPEKLALGLGGMGALALLSGSNSKDASPATGPSGTPAMGKYTTAPLPTYRYGAPGAAPTGATQSTASNGRVLYAPPTGYRHGRAPEFLFFQPQQAQAQGYKKGGRVKQSNGLSAVRHHQSPGGQDDRVPAVLAQDEYVVPADVVAHLGDGSSSAGGKRLDSMVKNTRRHKASKGGMPPRAKSPLAYVGSK